MSSRNSTILTPGPAQADHDVAAPQAVIDIGSNSIRLVVWQNGGRVPPVMFNEKTMAGLGRDLAVTGRLSDEAMDVGERTLARFAELTKSIGTARVRVVATAAVRQAANGRDFVERVHRNTGLEIEVLSGDAEAAASAAGVIAAIPGADGIVGDLGGGSLELVRIADNEIRERVSLPFGSLGVSEIRAKGPHALEQLMAKALKAQGWLGEGRDKPFYAVGGSWRAVSQVHMDMNHHPLPMVHQYVLPTAALPMLVRSLARMESKRLKMIPNLSASRIQTLPGASALLSTTVKLLGSSEVVISAWGLREGLLYQQLPAAVREQDPLIEAARTEGEREGRFPGQGDDLYQWISPLFADEGPEMARLRHAACLLGDVAWRAHPDFRPDRGLEFALHGNWVGIDGFGRALLGAALFANFGGPVQHYSHALLGKLADQESLQRARLWGLAMRLGFRLTGGCAHELRDIRIIREDDAVIMRIPAARKALYGDAIARRHKALANAMALDARLELT